MSTVAVDYLHEKDFDVDAISQKETQIKIQWFHPSNSYESSEKMLKLKFLIGLLKGNFGLIWAPRMSTVDPLRRTEPTFPDGMLALNPCAGDQTFKHSKQNKPKICPD